MMTVKLTGLAIAAFLAAIPAAQAGTIYTQDFNDPGFLGTSLNLSGNDLTSERWINTTYNNINNFAGWTFTGGAYLAVNADDPTQQALLLNENGPTNATYNLTGLNAGQTYEISFNLSGDNRPGDQYGFLLDVNGTQIASVNGTWTVHDTGTEEQFFFKANSSGDALLDFSEDSTTQASPIIDDIAVSTVPEPASLGLLGAALATLGVWRTRKKNKISATV
ncbi:MAG TPA: PEP-CTERM sorting domain-containing protein [Rhizomicrobium sp.]|jgi:hypothetical protein